MTQNFPSFAEALRVWLRIGLLSFGGPAAQIAVMHREVVEQRHWVSDARFLHALNFCMLLPGPEAQQLATYLGWLMHGVRGGLVAGLLFILPGAAVMLALSIIYATLGDVPIVAALFFGLKCAVLVLVVEALIKVAKRALKGPVPVALAIAAFAALALFNVPFPLVVLGALAIGFALPQAFGGAGHGAAKDGPPALLDAAIAADPERPARMAGAMALRARNAGRPRPRGNHARAFDFGAAICGLPRGLSRRWCIGWCCGQCADAVGDIRALLCLDFSGCALC